jgi:hypothetical protein
VRLRLGASAHEKRLKNWQRVLVTNDAWVTALVFLGPSQSGLMATARDRVGKPGMMISQEPRLPSKVFVLLSS